MDTITARLTVCFEAPFWVGIYERETDGQYEVCKITFGAEPKDYEVYDFLLWNWHRLRFSPAVETGRAAESRVNPKRLRREIGRLLEAGGTGTKAQRALQLQREEGKAARKIVSREEREAEKDRRFALRQEKRKNKHKGH